MSRGHHVVIVAQNPTLAGSLLAWLIPEGYECSVVTTFAGGKELIARGPGVLITELKLGEHNGLHLALRARSAGVPSIVIGPRDPVLQRDAHDLGATYLSSVLHRQQLLTLVSEHFHASVVTPARPLDGEATWMKQSESDSLSLHMVASRRVLH